MNVDDLRKLYIKNKMVFDKESPKVYVNNKHYTSPENLFNLENVEENLFIW